jgi:hypothetical protein
MELPPSYPRAAITAAERKLQRDFLDRFSPGRLVLVDSPTTWSQRFPGGPRASSGEW